MPPRRSRRAAGQDPEQLEMVEKGNPVEGDCADKCVAQDKDQDNMEKDQGKLEEGYVGTVAADGKDEVKVEIGERKSGEEECFAKINDESKGVKAVKNGDVEPTSLAVEDFGKPVEGPDGAEATCSVKVLQVDAGKGNPAEPGSAGELGSHIQKRVFSSSRRLNASSSDEEFYSAEDKVTIYLVLYIIGDGQLLQSS